MPHVFLLPKGIEREPKSGGVKEEGQESRDSEYHAKCCDGDGSTGKVQQGQTAVFQDSEEHRCVNNEL